MRKSEIVKTNGLRVYLDTAGAGPFRGDRGFYSRRAAGPYYHWHYEDGLGRWRVSRVHLSDLAVKALCKASWQSVPGELKAEMVNHYQE
jgi:hypothetical protein